MGLNQVGWKPATAMLDWAFAHGTAATPVGRLVSPGELAAAPSATPTPASAAAPLTNDLTRRSAAGAVSPAARWAGFAGLACAAAIVVGLGLSYARRPSRDGPR
jgi:D-alanyl-D-alanine carboxypeptidase (penicillin-binding protein 5/6)